MLYEEAMAAMRKGEHVCPIGSRLSRFTFFIEDINGDSVLNVRETFGCSIIRASQVKIDMNDLFFCQWEIVKKPRKLISFKEMIDPLMEGKKFSSENFEEGEYIKMENTYPFFVLYYNHGRFYRPFDLRVQHVLSKWYLVE